MIVVDAPKPQYIVIVIHDEYEQSVRFYAGMDAALEDFDKHVALHNEVYLSKIL